MPSRKPASSTWARLYGPGRHRDRGRSLMVMPGLVDVHCHSGDEPIAKGCSRMRAPAALWGNALYEYSALVDSDADAKAACQTVMLGDLMRSGVTTFLDIASPHPKWLSLAVQSGFAPIWRRDSVKPRGAVVDSHRLDFDWNKARGRERYARRSPSSMRRARTPPAASTAWSRLRRSRPAARLIQEAVASAQARHAASPSMRPRPWPSTRSCCVGPARPLPRCWNASAFSARTHPRALHLSRSPFVDPAPYARRSRAPLESGTSVAHCPVTFARSGMTLESLGGYRRAGGECGHRHRQLSVQHAGGDARGSDLLACRRTERVRYRYRGRVLRRHDRRREALGRQDIGRLAGGREG